MVPTPAPSLSPDQADAWDRVAEMLSDSGIALTDGLATPRDDEESRILAVTGKAGSGKTLLLAELVRACREAGLDLVSGDYERKRRDGRTLAVLAPTNKAASVLRTRGVPATTIHRILYTPVYDPEYEKIAEWLAGDRDRPETDVLPDEGL
ncbi:MAG: AAA family ATPase, partial [Pseudomonadota bacterium]